MCRMPCPCGPKPADRPRGRRPCPRSRASTWARRGRGRRASWPAPPRARDAASGRRRAGAAPGSPARSGRPPRAHRRRVLRMTSRASPRFSGPNATSSSTEVATIWSSGCWKTIPTCSRSSRIRDSSLVAIPSTETVPLCGSRIPLDRRASVDLPEPFAPENRDLVPGATDSVTPASARTPSGAL